MNKKLFSYFAYRDFDVLKYNVRLFWKYFVAILSILLTLLEIIQYTTNIQTIPIIFFLGEIIVCAVSAILFTCHQIKQKCVWTINLKDSTSITLAVDDYINNVYRFPTADCVFGCNNQFNLSTVKEDSLQYDIINTFWIKNSKIYKKRKNKYEKAKIKYEIKQDKLLFKKPIHLEDQHNSIYNKYYFKHYNRLKDKIDNIKQKIDYLKSEYQNKVKEQQDYINSYIRNNIPNSPKDSYPFGSIVYLKLTPTQNVVMFANSKKVINSTTSNDMFNGTNSTLEDIYNIWEFYIQKHAMQELILIPLLGTGHSHDNTPIDSAKKIVDLFFEYNISNEHTSDSGIRNIVISIHPNDIINHKIDLEQLKWYIIEHSIKNGCIDSSNIFEI